MTEDRAAPGSDTQAASLRRLRSAAGHLNAVIKMAEGGRPCEQVLHQLGAVQAALRAAGVELLACQCLQSEVFILASPSTSQRAAELRRLRSLYGMLNSYAPVSNEETSDN